MNKSKKSGAEKSGWQGRQSLGDLQWPLDTPNMNRASTGSYIKTSSFKSIYCLCIAFSAALILLLTGCDNKPTPKQSTDVATKGEFAFLLQYNGQMPSEVGFMTNHVVERRLANILKDSFQVFMTRAQFDRPIMVSAEDRTVAALFYSDSDRTIPSATVTIDVANDAIWADYLCGDSIIEYTDHPSLPKPGLVD